MKFSLAAALASIMAVSDARARIPSIFNAGVSSTQSERVGAI